MRAGINGLTAALVVGVVIGLMLTPDGREWLRHPTLMLGGSANASASPPTAGAPVESPAPPPVAKASVTPLKARAASGALRIGVFGDSMADGLWAALYRDLNGKQGVTVTQFSAVSTGLTRYDYVDIQAKTARQLSENRVDAAVVMFGTNDAQGISLDGVIHDFGTPGWKAAYGKRIDDLVALMRSRGVAVYWVGLPKMKRAGFDAKMAIINAVVRERMAALGVPLIETTDVTADAAGDYAAYLPGASGRPQLMRANDGIHMTMAGYRRMGAPVAERLKRDASLDVAAAQPQTTG
ncbi:DUF459 domain-containing protein [Brevundimonas sp. SL130]|uniref:SGNH/GDSL hydrolase family protein n=1 Tax=Brevundimonas sp. SL130 TaxID=2995143 RepID=UPI00226D1CE0|nr:DUF459 domain-containing protein [Brevundimonas sp. SL130]WAC59104.1 DUF459 domain-containing protein [Brevundimonas sp. SL130]